MRKLVYAINTTLDGCCDHTKFGPDEETFRDATALGGQTVRVARLVRRSRDGGRIGCFPHREGE